LTDYRDLNQLNWLYKKLALHEVQRDEIINDMNQSNISFEDTMKSVSYDKPIVQTSGVCGLEKIIDFEYEKLQKELDSINKKIADTKTDIRLLEEKTAKLSHFIKLLSEEAQMFLELYYHKKKKSYVAIGLELNVSHSTVGRLKKEILQQVELFLSYS
jgi:DNA-directed RNA polymerase specialized sigma subunit